MRERTENKKMRMKYGNFANFLRILGRIRKLGKEKEVEENMKYKQIRKS